MFLEIAWKRYRKTAKKYKELKTTEGYGEGYREDYTTSVAGVAAGTALGVFLIIFIITVILILPFALYFTWSKKRCGNMIPLWGKIVITILFFSPYIGGPIALIMIVVGFSVCSSKNKESLIELFRSLKRS